MKAAIHVNEATVQDYERSREAVLEAVADATVKALTGLGILAGSEDRAREEIFFALEKVCP